MLRTVAFFLFGLVTIGNCLKLRDMSDEDCFTTAPKQPDTPEPGQTGPFCHLKGAFFYDGTSFVTHDCFRCECTGARLKCCGYGYKSGEILHPAECMEVHHGCERAFVMKDDPDMPCDWRLPF